MLDKLTNQYGPALSRLPPGFLAPFDNAAAATETLNRVSAARKQALEAYQKSAVGRLVGAPDANAVERIVGGMFSAKTAVRDFRSLAAEAARDKSGAALDGLRRAVLDHIETRYLRDTAKGNEIKGKAFQDFVGQNGAALAQVFKPEQMNMLHAISQDIARSSLEPGSGPGLSKKILPYLKKAGEEAESGHGHGGSLLWKLGTTLFGAKELGEMFGLDFHSMGPVELGAAGGAWLGVKLLSHLRAAGMRKVADLIKEGVLNPEVGRALVMKASAKPDQGAQAMLAHALRRVSTFGPLLPTTP